MSSVSEIDTKDPWVNKESLSSKQSNSGMYLISEVVDNVPESYDRIYNELKSEYEKIEPKYLEKMLIHSRLQHSDCQEILDLIHQNQQNNPLFVTRNAFNLFLALVALAQADKDISLESVIEHRHNLPTPSFQTTEPVLSPPPTPHDIHQHKMNRWLSDLDTILVLRTPEREGRFPFSHVNYQLESEKLGTRVLRRYSDFHYLWQVLLSRYPFRLIPRLPSKQFTARTEAFEENRRRGLERFINAVARHPVLGQDNLVNIFLTHPSSIQSWRQLHPSVELDEEFTRMKNDMNLIEKMVPLDWEDRIGRMKKRSCRSISHYDHMLTVMRQMIQFKRALGTDYIRYSMTINDLAESDKDCPCQGCPRLAQAQSQVAKSMQQAGMMLNREAIAIADHVVECLVQQKNLLEAFIHLLERKESDIPSSHSSLAQTIANYRTLQDTPALNLTHQREIFIRYSILSEISLIHKSQVNLSKMYNNYVKDELIYSRQWMDHWDQLLSFTQHMPNTPDDFC